MWFLCKKRVLINDVKKLEIEILKLKCLIEGTVFEENNEFIQAAFDAVDKLDKRTLYHLRKYDRSALAYNKYLLKYSIKLGADY